MKIKREMTMRHMSMGINTVLEWDPSCPSVVDVTVGQDGTFFHFGLDREVLARSLVGEQQQNEAPIRVKVVSGTRVRLTIKVKPPGEDAVRKAELWGVIAPWADFLRNTEQEVPIGSERQFHEGDVTYLEALGITLPKD